MRATEDDDVWGPLIALLSVVFGLAVTIGLCLYMSANHSFNARCSKVYEPNSAAHERCVVRASDGGPIHEENIGKI